MLGQEHPGLVTPGVVVKLRPQVGVRGSEAVQAQRANRSADAKRVIRAGAKSQCVVVKIARACDSNEVIQREVRPEPSDQRRRS